MKKGWSTNILFVLANQPQKRDNMLEDPTNLAHKRVTNKKQRAVAELS
jgi:hypothetical protein